MEEQRGTERDRGRNREGPREEQRGTEGGTERDRGRNREGQRETQRETEGGTKSVEKVFDVLFEEFLSKRREVETVEDEVLKGLL